MARPLALVGDAPEPASPPRAAIAAKGFRPFFLLAAAFAIAIVPLWLAVIAGAARPDTYLDPVSWHAHEMIFGFTVAVVAGFLLTAVSNWTQRETVVRAPLLALAAVWAAGRVTMLTAARLPWGVPALVDLAFLPMLVVALARPLVAARNRRNFVMLAVLGALFAANVVAHLDALGLAPVGSARRACLVAVDLVLVVALVIAGRVVPMFTRNATGVESIRSIPALDAATVLAMVAVAAADALAGDTPVFAGALAGLTGLLALARAAHWGTRHTLRHPLLWVLHAGYAWATIGLLLRCASAFGAAVPASLATHAMTVGAIGSLTLGMMARVSLGHTGRPLAVSPAMAAAFAAINVAAAARVAVPLFAPSFTYAALLVAGAAWSFAFLAYLIVYAPILATPRADGKPG